MPTATKDPATGKFVAAKAGDEKATAAGSDTDAEDNLSGIRAFAEEALGIEREPGSKKKGGENEEAKEGDEGAPKKKVAAAPAAKPAAKPKPAPAPMTADEIASAASKGTAAAFAERDSKQAVTKKTVSETQADDTAALPQEEQRRLKVLAHMEKEWPEKYKGHSEKWKNYLKAFSEYADKWETENPGQTFDENSNDHEAFRAKHEPKWDDDDYEEARIDVKVNAKESNNAALEAELKKTNERLSEYDRKEKLRDSAYVIEQEKVVAARNVWKRFGKDYEGIIKEDGTPDNAKLEELSATDPIGTEARVRAARNVNVLVEESYKLMNGLEKFNENNPAHAHLGTFALDQEEILLSKPAEDQLDAAGRSFKARAEFNKLSAADQKKFWTFGVADLGYMIAKDEAAKALKIIEDEEKRFNRIAEAKGLKASSRAEVKESAAEEEDEEDQLEQDTKPRSPSTFSAPKVAGRPAAGGNASNTPLDTWVKDALG